MHRINFYIIFLSYKIKFCWLSFCEKKKIEKNMSATKKANLYMNKLLFVVVVIVFFKNNFVLLLWLLFKFIF